MPIRVARLLLILVVAASAASAAPATASADEALPRPDLKEWRLPNGLDVVYLGVHKAPIVTVQVWYHVGSKDEQRDQRGSAHMFEHMMFKGTQHVPPEDHARLIDRIGGSENAFTAEDMTAYHETVPRQYLDFVVELEAERMRNLLIRQSSVNSEREVVKEEKRYRVDGSPIGRALERFRAVAFTKHPYSWQPAGIIEDLDRLTPAKLQKMYDSYYQPNNATLIVVGDVPEDAVRAAAEKWFGPVPAGPEPPRPAKTSPEPKQDKMRKETVGGGQLGLVIGGYHVPEAKAADIYPLRVLAGILAHGESSRLYERVVRKDQLGVFAGGSLFAFEDPGLFVIFGGYLAPDREPKLEAAMLDEIARLQKEPVTADELTKARNQLAAGFVFGLESVEGIAAQIGQSRLLRGDARAWIDDYAKYQAVTADDVQRVAKTYLDPTNLTLVIVPPAGGAQ
jgi:zinc protease